MDRILRKALCKIIYATQELDKKIMDLATNVIELGYDSTTEKELLDVLKNAYDGVKEKGIAAADLNWEANIRKNKENKIKQRQERLQQNKEVLRDYKMDHKVKDGAPQQIVKKYEPNKKLSRVKEQIENVIKVDFSRTDEDIAARSERIKKSIQKIDELMKELQKQSGSKEGA